MGQVAGDVARGVVPEGVVVQRHLLGSLAAEDRDRVRPGDEGVDHLASRGAEVERGAVAARLVAHQGVVHERGVAAVGDAQRAADRAAAVGDVVGKHVVLEQRGVRARIAHPGPTAARPRRPVPAEDGARDGEIVDVVEGGAAARGAGVADEDGVAYHHRLGLGVRQRAAVGVGDVVFEPGPGDLERRVAPEGLAVVPHRAAPPGGVADEAAPRDDRRGLEADPVGRAVPDRAAFAQIGGVVREGGVEDLHHRGASVDGAAAREAVGQVDVVGLECGAGDGEIAVVHGDGAAVPLGVVADEGAPAHRDGGVAQVQRAAVVGAGGAVGEGAVRHLAGAVLVPADVPADCGIVGGVVDEVAAGDRQVAVDDVDGAARRRVLVADRVALEGRVDDRSGGVFDEADGATARGLAVEERAARDLEHPAGDADVAAVLGVAAFEGGAADDRGAVDDPEPDAGEAGTGAQAEVAGVQEQGAAFLGHGAAVVDLEGEAGEGDLGADHVDGGSGQGGQRAGGQRHRAAGGDEGQGWDGEGEQADEGADSHGRLRARRQDSVPNRPGLVRSLWGTKRNSHVSYVLQRGIARAASRRR